MSAPQRWQEMVDEGRGADSEFFFALLLRIFFLGAMSNEMDVTDKEDERLNLWKTG